MGERSAAGAAWAAERADRRRRLSPWDRAGICPPFYVPAANADDLPGFKLIVFGAPGNAVSDMLRDAGIPQPDRFEDLLDAFRSRRQLLTWRSRAVAERVRAAIRLHSGQRPSGAYVSADWHAPQGYDPRDRDRRFAL